MIEANLLPSPAAQVPTQHIRYQPLHEMQRNQTDKATAETQQTSLICQTNGVLLELITGSFALHITEGAFTYTVHSHIVTSAKQDSRAFPLTIMLHWSIKVLLEDWQVLQRQLREKVATHSVNVSSFRKWKWVQGGSYLQSLENNNFTPCLDFSQLNHWSHCFTGNWGKFHKTCGNYS